MKAAISHTFGAFHTLLSGQARMGRVQFRAFYMVYVALLTLYGLQIIYGLQIRGSFGELLGMILFCVALYASIKRDRDTQYKLVDLSPPPIWHVLNFRAIFCALAPYVLIPSLLIITAMVRSDSESTSGSFALGNALGILFVAGICWATVRYLWITPSWPQPNKHGPVPKDGRA